MIAINAAIWDRQPTGLGVVAREIASRVLKAGTDAAVFCSAGIEPTTAPASSAVHRVPDWARGRPGTLLGGLLRFLWTQAVLPSKLKAVGARVLLSPNHEAVFFPPCPQVVVVHDLLPLFHPQNRRKRLYFRCVFPWVLRRADAIVAVSENTKKDLIEAYGLPASKITVIYSGVDRSVFRREASGDRAPSPPYILFIGDQHPHKNLPGLIAAFAGLVQDGFPHHLVIAGRKDPRRHEELASLVRESGLEARVSFPGYVDEGSLAGLYSRADLFVLPSLYEGFGLPALEAMACGCPVAASGNSSLPEVCGTAARYFDPRDVSDMRRRIAEVLSDPQLRGRMAAEGLQQAERFRWEDAGRDYLALLTRIEKAGASR
ncbi:MAG: glycosyltransferase family 4 protein [Elusimicrobia bacterium]|nr:glycosyltransferase family 4 protein [Elusimicrobiota bacterium]